DVDAVRGRTALHELLPSEERARGGASRADGAGVRGRILLGEALVEEPRLVEALGARHRLRAREEILRVRFIVGDARDEERAEGEDRPKHDDYPGPRIAAR